MDSDQRLSTDEILTQFSNPELASHAYLDLYFQKWTPLKQLSELHSQSSQLLSQLDHATEDLTWQLEDIMTELKVWSTTDIPSRIIKEWCCRPSGRYRRYSGT